MVWSKPQLGVAAWTFGERPLPDTAQRIASLGYDGITLSIDVARQTPEATGQVLQAHDLTLFAVSLPDADLTHKDTAVRTQAISDYLRLLDFAAELGGPLVICRGLKGRTRPYTSRGEEMQWLATAVRQIAQAADEKGLKLVIEPLNRYETHLINTGAEALALIESVGMDNVGVYLNAFHMNLEEQDSAGVMRQVGERLWLYAMSDSNRRAIGQGHLKLGAHLWAIEDIPYNGPIILECLPPGSDLWQPEHDAAALAALESCLRDSRSWF
jgi:sugar phosphate isomerase/epimerase